MKKIKFIVDLFFIYVGIATCITPAGVKLPGRITFFNEDFGQRGNLALTLVVGLLIVAIGVTAILKRRIQKR